MKRYINIKGAHNSVETIEEIDSADYDTKREFDEACAFLMDEYKVAYKNSGYTPYFSSRCDKDWNK